MRFLRERTRTMREWMAADTLQRGRGRGRRAGNGTANRGGAGMQDNGMVGGGGIVAHTWMAADTLQRRGGGQACKTMEWSAEVGIVTHDA